ncbi:MAG: DUF1987 domain-containing protein [Bacteroidales bacterium]|nr:DUF1987 domain-containing protein [Bacteroidales bacterium]
MIIKETSNSPFVNISVDDCIFEIKGNSYSDSLGEIYNKIIKWIDEEMPEINCPIDCKFKFYVYNSITYKSILLIINKFHELKEKGKQINVIWYYDKEDEDNLATGKDISELFDIPVQLIENK